jgi:hypothetical protein
MKKAKIITNEISQNLNMQKNIFKLLLFALISLFVVYIYLVGSITFNIVARRTFENVVISLNSELNQLESEYLTNISKIDRQYAYTKGFVDMGQNIFVTRNINQVAVR